MWRPKRSGTGKATTFINEGSQLEGRASFRGVTVINGGLAGTDVTAETLIVGREAVITAAIHAWRVTVFGRVVGDITGRERVEVETGGHVSGDIDAPVLLLKDGAVFEGHCRTSGNVRTDAPMTAAVSTTRQAPAEGAQTAEPSPASDVKHWRPLASSPRGADAGCSSLQVTSGPRGWTAPQISQST